MIYLRSNKINEFQKELSQMETIITENKINSTYYRRHNIQVLSAFKGMLGSKTWEIRRCDRYY